MSAGANTTSLYKAVVLEVIYDLGFFNSEKLTELVEKLQVKNDDRLKNAPLNSCIVRLFGAGSDSGSVNSIVVYPLLPPHLSMPVKPGECVWVMSPKQERPDPEESYWLCRISGTKNASDINYTHWPRSFSQGGSGTESDEMRTSEKAAMAASTPESSTSITKLVESFPNKSKTGSVFERKPETPQNPSGGPDPFKTLPSTSLSYQQLVLEPVPNYTKRPGDMVLQGSNNTLICLGQDRGWTASDDTATITESETSNAYVKPGEFSGAIDIVAGRSRYMPPTAMNAKAEGDSFERTNTRIIENKRENLEMMKDPIKLGLTRNNAGGDPDLIVDASRLLVSMKTSADDNFGITSENKNSSAGFESPIEPITDAAYVVAKSDEIRIIARKQDPNKDYSVAEQPEINGSIRLIKEGDASDDLAQISLLPDGTVQVSGSKIFLGRSESDGGAGGGPGPGNSQPYVKYQQLEDLLNAILDDLDALAGELINNKSPGYGAPNVTVLSGGTALKAAVAQRKSEIANIKSDRIFGE